MTRKLHYHLVDVFTNERFGGNQLAVFTNGRGVPAETMQRIAKELNIAETTFVLPPDDRANDWKVLIFTPAVELPMAGHPTVGTAFVLAQEHLVDVSEAKPGIRLEEKVGLIPVTFSFENGAVSLITMEQPMPTFGPEFRDRQMAADMLSVDVADLDDSSMEVVSCGVPYLMIPLKTLGAVQKIKAKADVMERAMAGTSARMVFVFTRETVQPTSGAHSRMFGHMVGIPEDPATGSAAGPLGCYLVKHGILTENPMKIINEQGFEIGRPSYLHIEVRQGHGAINLVRVGGQCVAVGEGVIEIE